MADSKQIEAGGSREKKEKSHADCQINHDCNIQIKVIACCWSGLRVCGSSEDSTAEMIMRMCVTQRVVFELHIFVYTMKILH
jgi:hypothetical protein